MPQSPQFEKREDGVYLDDSRIAYFHEGDLRMTRGNAEHREDVEKFLGLESEDPAPKKSIITTGEPICPLPTDSDGGDKTPAVVEWWFKNHPDIAAKKYANRKITRTIDV